MSISNNIKKKIESLSTSKKTRRSLVEKAESIKTKDMTDEHLWQLIQSEASRNLED